MPSAFEVHVCGTLPAGAAELFGDLDVTHRGEVTVMRGEMDQAAFHGLMVRIHVLGLELLAVRRIRGGGPALLS